MAQTRTYNGSYTADNLDHVAFPLGGIGAGMICLEGTGTLSHVSVRGQPNVFNEPMMFAALHVRGDRPTALVLERLDDGVRETQHPGDLHGWYYYQVDGRNRGPFTHFNRDFRVLDPNALAAVGPAGPGIV